MARIYCRDGTHEFVLLAQLVELGVSIEHSRADELIEHSENNRWQHRKDDVVESEGPALLEDLARERVLERELREVQRVVRRCPKYAHKSRVGRNIPRSRSCTAQCSCRT